MNIEMITLTVKGINDIMVKLITRCLKLLMFLA